MISINSTLFGEMFQHTEQFFGRVPYVRPLAPVLSMEHHSAQYKDALGLAPLNLNATCLDSLHGPRFAGRLSYFSFHGHLGVYDYSFEPTFIRKRNERERQRVRCVNEGYARLREHLPQEFEDKRLSKVETLRAAINYINHLQGLLDFNVSSSGIVELSLGERRSNASAPQSSEWNNSDGESRASLSDGGEVQY